MHKLIPITSIAARQGLREADDDYVSVLLDDFRHSNRLAALLVREQAPDQYELLGGTQRLAVAKKAGQSEVWVQVIKADDWQAEVNAILDNLGRKQPRHELLAKDSERLVALYEERPGNTVNQVDSKKRGQPKGAITSAAESCGITRQAMHKRLQKQRLASARHRAKLKAEKESGGPSWRSYTENGMAEKLKADLVMATRIVDILAHEFPEYITKPKKPQG